MITRTSCPLPFTFFRSACMMPCWLSSLSQLNSIEFVLKGADVTITATMQVPEKLASLLFLSESQAKYLAELTKALPTIFSGLIDHVATRSSEWQAFLNDPNCEQSTPQPWHITPGVEQSDSVRLLRTLILFKGLCPDHIIAGGNTLMEAMFGASFMRLPELDLGHLVEKEAGPSTPLVLCSMPGITQISQHTHQFLLLA